LMAWTEGVYGPVFSGVGPFALRENGEEEREGRRGWMDEQLPRACPPHIPRPPATRSPHLTYILLSIPPHQTTSSATSSLGATRRPSPRGGGCTTRTLRERGKTRPLGLGCAPPPSPSIPHPLPLSPSPSHSSFLWDFTPARMAMLTQPSRAPAYRAGRPHGAFVTSLRAAGAGDRAGLLSALPAALELLGRPHHRSTRVLVDGSGRAVEEGGA
jgi:hypothetical protein